jgi:hypothetical protein
VSTVVKQAFNAIERREVIGQADYYVLSYMNWRYCGVAPVEE